MYVSTKKYFDSVDSEDLSKTLKYVLTLSIIMALSFIFWILRIAKVNHFEGLFMIIWVILSLVLLTGLGIVMISAISCFFHIFIWLYFGRKGFSKTFKGVAHSVTPVIITVFITNILLSISEHILIKMIATILIFAAVAYFIYLFRIAIMVMQAFFASKASKAVVIAPLITIVITIVAYLIFLYIFLK